MEIKKYSYDQLTQLSDKDSMYILTPEKLKSFFKWEASIDKFPEIIQAKKKQNINRSVLADALAEQYKTFKDNTTQLELIDKLRETNSFTVTTAHQPSLFTGPLYYIFKIASVINLSRQLNQKYTEYNFIPCFITGGEDHDFEEINHLSVFGKKMIWETNGWKGGSVGQMNLEGLEELLDQLCEILGTNNYGSHWLRDNIHSLIGSSKNYSEFARKLTHALFGNHGLLILSMDDRRLKELYIPIIEKEIFESPSEDLIQSTQEKLSHLSWKSQAHARHINFFYRTKNQRSRIVFENDSYKTVDGQNSWTKLELEGEIKSNPDSFSPNVIMRPLYQESILPNLAYIGGGGEIAYWLERMSQFEHFEVPFPMLIRRNSAVIVPHSMSKQLNKQSLAFESYFVHPDNLVKLYLADKGEDAYSLNDQKEGLEELMANAITKAKSADPTLESFAMAEVTKMYKSIETIEKKISKAIKRKEEVDLNRISKIQDKLFPSNGLQERKENIFQFINDYGIDFLTKLIDELNPLEKKFTAFFMQAHDLSNQELKK